MSDLGNFQREFAKALTASGQAARSFRSQAFAVYRNTVARGVVEALRASFPTVDMLLGEEMFTQVALDYRRAKPPLGPVLSDYGSELPAFLARQPWSCELPYLADVALLDWLWLQSFLARDAATPQSISGNARIWLHPATRFAWLSTPAMTIWQAHRDPWSLAELEPEWVEEGALFTRPAECVRSEPIDPIFYGLLTACRTSMPVGELANLVAQQFPTANVPELLQRGVASGALLIQ